MENIRITSGEFRGRSIKSPNSKLTHPMGSREKLALFNMISDYLPGASVLDAFAGSGALGIEALSRGAGSAVFVEKSNSVSRIIKENVSSLGLDDYANIITGDVSSLKIDEKFDIIIADPPYDNFEPSKLKNLVALLKNTGIFVLSHPKEAPLIDGLELQKTRNYAVAQISVYRPISE